VLFFHTHLLNQFFLLSRKLFKLHAAPGSLPSELQDIHRELHFPLVFSYVIVGTHYLPVIRWVFRTSVIIIVLLVPIVLLAAIQWMFLPYHSDWITFNHQLVLTLDLILLWIFWPRLSSHSDRWRVWWPWSWPRRRVDFVRPRSWRQRQRMWGVLASTLLLLIGIWILLVPPGHGIERLIGYQPWPDWMHRTLVLREQILMRKEPPPELLVNAENEQDRARIWQEAGEALDLSGRDLRHADFSGSTLWNVNLRDAQLQGAIFQGAQLQGADLSEAQLQDADLRGARLKNANLSLARLQGMDLGGLELQNRDVQWAQLQGANLQEAQVQGADLQETKLQGSNLRYALVYGIKLRRTELSFADLRNLRSLPVGWEGLSELETPLYEIECEMDWELFSEIEELEAKLETEGEHWPQNGRKRVEQAIDRFWSAAFLPFEPTVISPPQESNVMHDGRGPFTNWPAPPEAAEFEQARAGVSRRVRLQRPIHW